MRRLAASLAAISLLLLPTAPAFALGELPPPPTDTTPPVISAVVAASVSSIAESITWITDELSVSTFQYGTTMSYGSSASVGSGLAIGGIAALTGLSPSTTYYYCIHATDAANNASQSCGSFTTAAAPEPEVPIIAPDTSPPSIVDVSSVSLESHTATVAWTANELAVSTLEYGTTVSYGSSGTLSGSALLAHTAELTGLSANTTYHYCIHATDLAGNVANSCGHSFTTAAGETMLDTNPPTVSLVTAAPITTTSATIGWTTSEVAGGYVEYGTDTGYGSQTTFDTNLALTHEASLTGLSPHTEYHYRVHSRDEAGNTVVTPDETFTTLAIPVVTPPSDTTPPSIQNIFPIPLISTATIEWDTNELAVSTLEYGMTSSYGHSATLSASALLAHSTALAGLSPNTTYYYCIHATDLAGNNASSCGHSFTTEHSATPPDTTPPSILLVLHSSLGTSSATVAWSTNEPAESLVEYGTTLSYGSETPRTSSYDLTGSAPLTGLSLSTTYHYRVYSYDAAGNESISPDYTLTTESASVSGGGSAPETISFSAIEPSSVGETGATITWQTNLPGDSIVEYGYGEAFDHSVSDPSLVTSHSLTLSGLDPDTTYEFRVISAPADGLPLVSDTYEFTTLAVPIIVDPPANITSVSALPSGTSASISFATDEAAAGWIEYGATTAYGSLATSTSGISHTLSLSGLAPGTYHYRVKAIDSGDNLTYSADRSFTIETSLGGGLVPIEETSTTTESVTPIQASTGGGSGGGGGSVASGPAPAPNLVTAEGLDSQIAFGWRNPETSGFVGTLVVRKEGDYPQTPSDGTVLYRGSSETFTDTSLANGTTYYYALYSYNAGGQYSSPIRVSSAPQSGVTQVQLERNAVEEQALSVEHFEQDLRRGDQNLEVEHLQQVLNVVNVHPSRLTTGYFGALTETALKQFQQQNNLPQTGIADAATRAALDAISDGWMVPGAPSDLASLDHDLKLGDTEEEVGDLQELLAFEGSYPNATISGYFGARTQNGVKAFQTSYGVTPVSGYVGYKTRHTIQTVLGL